MLFEHCYLNFFSRQLFTGNKAVVSVGSIWPGTNPDTSEHCMTMPGSCTTSRSGVLTVTTIVKPIKAKCNDNQDGLDRLQAAMVKAQSSGNVNYSVTLSRAIKSLKDCPEPIRTQKDACKLKYIGPAIAKTICPSYHGATSSTSKPSPKTANTSTKRKAAASAGAIVGPAKKLAPASNEPVKFVLSAKQKAYDKAKREAENLTLPPKGRWKVILLVDGREVRSKHVVSCCKQSGIPCEERHLPIGDMAWIARCEKFEDGSRPPNQPLEIMVGTIIERKEVADLASSLYGTRYNEQRLRLSQCGLPQVLFLVEGELTAVTNCPADALQMAMMETRIQLGFQIVQTKHLTDTVRVLKGLHRRIVQRTFPDAFDVNSGTGVPTFTDTPYDGPRNADARRRRRRPSSLLEMVFDTTPVAPFDSNRFITYPELKAKVELDREQGTRSVQAITLAMLKQIPSLSQKKCTAIARAYPTFNRLIEAMYYSESDPTQLVSGIEIDRRTIGPKSAQEVYAACCTLEDGCVVGSHSAPPTAASEKLSAKHPLEVAKSDGTITITSKSKDTSSGSCCKSASTEDAGNDGGRDSSPIVLDTPPPLNKRRIKSMDEESVVDLLTPQRVATAKISRNDGKLSDVPGWSTDTASTKEASMAREKENKDNTIQYGRRLPVSKCEDSFLFSSPDCHTSSRPSPGVGRADKSAKPNAGHISANNSSYINLLDSDTDEEIEEKSRNDMQNAIRASLSDTPSTTSAISSPAIQYSNGNAARKISDGSTSNDDSFLMSSPEEPSSLRERLALKMGKDVIDLLDD
jgi:ERCC4-type nuclease